jgi:SSS family solute:Na+ symporter
MRVSRLTNAAAVLLSVGAASFALHFHSLMEYIQLVLSTFNAPLFALVLLAVALPGRVYRGGGAGFLTGLAFSIVHQVLVAAGLLHYGSQMAANFYGAILGFCTALAGTAIAAKAMAARKETGDGQARSWEGWKGVGWPAFAGGACICGLFLVFNWIFW